MVVWRAVGFGLAVVALLGVLGFQVPLVGHAAAGVAGGFVAGVLGGGGVRGGAEHGAAAGLVGAAFAAAVGVVLATTVGFDALFPPFIRGVLVDATGLAPGTLFALGVVSLAVGAAGAGALGGLVRGDRPLPSDPGARRGG